MLELDCLGLSNSLASETCQFQSLRRRQKDFEEWVGRWEQRRKKSGGCSWVSNKSHWKPNPTSLGTQTYKISHCPCCCCSEETGWERFRSCLLIILSVASPSLESKHPNLDPKNTLCLAKNAGANHHPSQPSSTFITLFTHLRSLRED